MYREKKSALPTHLGSHTIMLFFFLWWTLQEYVVHRFVLNTVRHPLLPAILTITLALVNCAIAWWLGGAGTFIAVVCYGLFEMSHWHSSLGFIVDGPRRFHLRHQSSKGTLNFGFTSATWDILFDTCDRAWTMTTFGTLLLLVPVPVLPLMLFEVLYCK
jgi:hypothetical protein